MAEHGGIVNPMATSFDAQALALVCGPSHQVAVQPAVESELRSSLKYVVRVPPLAER